MTIPQRPALEDRAKEVAQVSAWAALGITVVTAGTANAAFQALALGLMGGTPKFGVDSFETLVGAFLVTAPLAIAVTIVGLGLARIEFSDDPQNYKVLGFIAVAILIGLVIGNMIYQALYSVILEVNYQDLSSTLSRTSGPPFMKLAAGIIWFLIGYYEFFGFGHFFAAFFAGGAAAYAAHRFLPGET